MHAFKVGKTIVQGRNAIIFALSWDSKGYKRSRGAGDMHCVAWWYDPCLGNLSWIVGMEELDRFVKKNLTEEEWAQIDREGLQTGRLYCN